MIEFLSRCRGAIASNRKARPWVQPVLETAAEGLVLALPEANVRDRRIDVDHETA
jgi:hypothetical protein